MAFWHSHQFQDHLDTLRVAKTAKGLEGQLRPLSDRALIVGQYFANKMTPDEAGNLYRWQKPRDLLARTFNRSNSWIDGAIRELIEAGVIAKPKRLSRREKATYFWVMTCPPECSTAQHLPERTSTESPKLASDYSESPKLATESPKLAGNRELKDLREGEGNPSLLIRSVIQNLIKSETALEAHLNLLDTNTDTLNRNALEVMAKATSNPEAYLRATIENNPERLSKTPRVATIPQPRIEQGSATISAKQLETTRQIFDKASNPGEFDRLPETEQQALASLDFEEVKNQARTRNQKQNSSDLRERTRKVANRYATENETATFDELPALSQEWLYRRATASDPLRSGDFATALRWLKNGVELNPAWLEENSNDYGVAHPDNTERETISEPYLTRNHVSLAS